MRETWKAWNVMRETWKAWNVMRETWKSRGSGFFTLHVSRFIPRFTFHSPFHVSSVASSVKTNQRANYQVFSDSTDASWQHDVPYPCWYCACDLCYLYILLAWLSKDVTSNILSCKLNPCCRKDRMVSTSTGDKKWRLSLNFWQALSPLHWVVQKQKALPVCSFPLLLRFAHTRFNTLNDNITL